jgi:hypothetical protein
VRVIGSKLGDIVDLANSSDLGLQSVSRKRIETCESMSKCNMFSDLQMCPLKSWSDMLLSGHMHISIYLRAFV